MHDSLMGRTDVDECAEWSARTIQRVVEGRGGWFLKRKRRRMVLHLLAGCERCAEELRSTVRTSGAEGRDPCDCDVAQEKTGLFERAIERLGSMERPAQEIYIAGVQGLKTEDFVRWAVGRARKLLTREPEKAVDIAKIAMLAAEGLSPDVRAFAALYMGHVWGRARSDFIGADTWFDRALGILAEHETDPRLRAKLLRMQGLSRYNQSRSDEAIALFDKAARIYQTVGDLNQLGQTYVDSAGAVGEERGPEQAISRLFKATCLVDFDKYPRYALAIAGNLSHHHADLGQPEKALGFLEITRELIEKQGAAPADFLRLEWSAGRILAEAGKPAQSLELFRRAREGFVALGLAGEAGQISLDLALSLLQLGRMRELREVAEEMLPIFRSQLLHKEAIAAVEFFREAVVAQTVTAAQIHAVSDFLRALQAGTNARFRRPAE